MEPWTQEVIEITNARLVIYFDAKREEANSISPAAIELTNGVADLTLRGGKRLRAVVMGAAFRAVNPEGDLNLIANSAASIEILQSYLLIHDDWMDRDVERRGGPAVHAAFVKQYGDEHLGACLGILAGDLGGAYAWELHLESPFPAARQKEAHERFLRLQKEVYFGQQLDAMAHPDVALMHSLKTTSYTVVGPLLLGALLADASQEQIDSLKSYGEPLGQAFQLRDDLIGTFGDSAHTGKPSGNDLREGKFNAVVARAKAEINDADREPIERVLGNAAASETEVAAAIELLTTRGIREAIENEVERELALAEAAIKSRNDLEAAPLIQVAHKLARRTY